MSDIDSFFIVYDFLKFAISFIRFSAFDISSYKNGDMENAYNVYVNGPSGESPKTTTAGAQVDRSEPSSSTPAESAAAQPVEISNTNGLTLETSTPVENNINGFY